MQLASYLTKSAVGPSSPGSQGKSQGNFKIGSPYKVEGQWYYPQERYEMVETGIASWYGSGFHGRKTANGEKFNKNELTAAHRTLQMPSLVRVTNLDNGRSVIVRVNDRGPYARGRVIDVSEKTASLLGFKNIGTAKVKLEVLRDESLKIAQAARMGKDTRGFELAVNRGQEIPVATYQVASADSNIPVPLADVSPNAPIQPVSSEALVAAKPVPVPGHISNGEFYPDPVVSQSPVRPSGIYVQAGAFTVYDNALRLKDTLKPYAVTTPASVRDAIVGGRTFYRVRLGPVASVGQADRLLASLVNGGVNNAIIVVE